LLSAPGTAPNTPFSNNRLTLINANFDLNHVLALHKLGFDPEDFQMNAAGDHIQLIDPSTGNPHAGTDFAGFEPLQGKKAI